MRLARLYSLCGAAGTGPCAGPQNSYGVPRVHSKNVLGLCFGCPKHPVVRGLLRGSGGRCCLCCFRAYRSRLRIGIRECQVRRWCCACARRQVIVLLRDLFVIQFVERPGRLSLGGLLLSRVRLRFAGASPIRLHTDCLIDNSELTPYASENLGVWGRAPVQSLQGRKSPTASLDG